MVYKLVNIPNLTVCFIGGGWGWGDGSVSRLLLYSHEATVVHACNLSCREAETGRSPGLTNQLNQ